MLLLINLFINLINHNIIIINFCNQILSITIVWYINKKTMRENKIEK